MDISVIAYLINKNWFKEEIISCPTKNDNTTYSKTQNGHKISMVNYLDADKIYADLFGKLGVKENIN